MSNNYWTFLDYLELRRRVERHLWRGKWLIVNITLFVIMATIFFATSNSFYFNGYAVFPDRSYLMSFWSVMLALHGIVTFFKSGAWLWKRNQVVEDQMRERLHDDAYMNENPRHLFSLHRLLENNIGARAEHVTIAAIFGIANALMWVVWATLSDMRGSQPWQLTLITSVFILLPILIGSLIHGVRYEQAVRKKIETMEETTLREEAAPKQKRFAQEAHMRLSDDGELITIDDDMDGLKQKRRV